MVRRKTEMKLIENTASRQVTFVKRRNGLLKKAFELSVLCDARVALIIFSAGGKLFEFSSSCMLEMIDRYEKHEKLRRSADPLAQIGIDHQQPKPDPTRLIQKIQQLETSERKLLGENIGTCTTEELHQIEKQLESSLRRIRKRKMQLRKQKTEHLKAEEKALAAENARLREKLQGEPQDEPRMPTATAPVAITGVEIDLLVGFTEEKERVRHALL